MKLNKLMAAVVAAGMAVTGAWAAGAEEAKEIQLNGSSVLYPGCVALAQRFMELNPGTKVSNGESDSGKGIQMLIEGKIDVARSGRAVEVAEFDAALAKGKNLKMFQVGFDAVAVMIHPSRGKKVKSLTKKQIKSIFFDGSIKDWSQIDPGLSGPIHLYVRDSKTSGVGEAFSKMIAGSKTAAYAPGAKFLDASPKLVTSVAADPLGMTYSPFSFIDASVSAPAYQAEGAPVPPTLETVRNGTYGLSRELYLIAASNPGRDIARFLDFTLSAEGQKIIGKNGIVPIK